MYYNVVLVEPPRDDSFQSPDERVTLMNRLKRLSKDNEDFFDQNVYPITICRCASQEETAFYRVFATSNHLKVDFIPISCSVFEVFQNELSIVEQDEDAHMISKGIIKEKLVDGATVLREFEEASDAFTVASDNIRSKVLEWKEMQFGKFYPTSWAISFIMWAIFAVVYFLKNGISLDSAFIPSILFLGIITLSVVYDYVYYRKKKNKYFSLDGQKNFWDAIEENNILKNEAIHSVEALIDSMTARRCLTILSIRKRNLESIQDILSKIDDATPNELISMIC